MNSDQKKRRHINTDHLAMVLLGALVLIFILVIVLARVLPKNTTPSELTLAEQASATQQPADSSDKKAPSYSGSTEATSTPESTASSETEINKNAAIAVIDQDLSKQVPSWKKGEIEADDLTFKASGDSLTVTGSAENHTFTYILKKSGSAYAVSSRNISGVDDKDDKDKDDSSTANLPSLGSYDVTVNNALTADVSISSGTLRVDVTDDSGKTQTIFKESGPYQNSNFTASLPSGHYQVNLYGDASGWNFSFQAN